MGNPRPSSCTNYKPETNLSSQNISLRHRENKILFSVSLLVERNADLLIQGIECDPVVYYSALLP